MVQTLSSKVLYRYEREWSSAAQNNLLWRFAKLLYTQATLDYLGAAFIVGLPYAVLHVEVHLEHLGRASCCASA